MRVRLGFVPSCAGTRVLLGYAHQPRRRRIPSNMAEGELDVDSLISRLLEGEFSAYLSRLIFKVYLWWYLSSFRLRLWDYIVCFEASERPVIRRCEK